MIREFNVEGLCNPKMHYMIDIGKKLEKIIELIEKNKYFTINRARQYGKTTTLSRIYDTLKDKYIVLEISFEGLGDGAFDNESAFINSFLKLIFKRFKENNISDDILNKFINNRSKIQKFDDLSDTITELVESVGKGIILLIDEVDKASNNQLFLNFLGMLRNKYLERSKGYGGTFKSVVLAGVYDVKNLKLKIRENEERKYNSPWNIAADFHVNMSFNPEEISTMLVEYEKDFKTGMDIPVISEEIYKYTSGYPFLVSKICKIIDERLERDWTADGVQNAVKELLEEKNTLFDDLIKNLENDHRLYQFVYDILIEGKQFSFNIHTPIIDLGQILGIISKRNGLACVSNKIFELCIYNYMISKRSIEIGEIITYEYRTQFAKDDKLNMTLALDKFQEIMKEEYRDKDSKFIEREGRLLFLCFLKPIINGKGFYYVEPETRMDNRMDIVVTYGKEQFIVELKIWHGENYESEALRQLAGYLESKRENKGYLISFSFNKGKKYTKEWKKHEDKDIYAVVV